MFQNGLYGLWGFLKLLFWIGLLFLVVAFYFWGDHMKETARPWIEKARQTSVVAYGEKIWNKMRGIQELRGERTQRALELVGQTKVITEKTGRYSFQISETWKEEQFGAAAGGQLSKVVLTSPTFSERKEGADIFFDNGARLTVQVFRGEQPSARSGDGGHGRNLIRKNNADIPGISAQYHAIKDPLVKKGEVLDLHLISGGNTYFFRYEFNPEKFNGGEFTFQEMLASFKFGK